jgi:hypothetical protein
VFAAEIQHLLRFLDAADERAGETFASKDQAAGVNGEWFGWNANLRERAVAFQQGEASVDVVLRGHGVEDEMKTVRLFLHRFFIAGDVDISVADAAVKDLNLHVVRSGLAAFKGERRGRGGLGQGGESFGVYLDLQLAQRQFFKSRPGHNLCQGWVPINRAI